MLPGFRFLFAAILLSTSILVFGLGAAALLRASHEQYVSNPSWRNGPQEKVFAQAAEPAQPVLAALRAEPETTAAAEPSVRDLVPTVGLPTTAPEQVAALTIETEDQPQHTSPPAETAIIEPPKAETTTQAPAQPTSGTPGTTETTASLSEASPPPAPDVKTDLKPDLSSAEPAVADPAAALASPPLDVAPTKLAVLNEPAPTTAKDSQAKDAQVKDAQVKAKPEAKPRVKRKAKARKRHRIVRRPPPQQLQQQQQDPFAQQPMFATTPLRTR